MKKTVINLLILIVHINLSAQKIEIDTFYHENAYTITKRYEYPKYYLDSMFYSLDKKWYVFKNEKDQQKAYLDSLHETPSFINRKLLPTKRVPENFMISVNIRGGCLGPSLHNMYLFYNKGEGVVITQNSYSIKGISRINSYRFSYFKDSLANKIIKKLNTGMYWDSITAQPPIIRDVIYSGISSGDISLYFNYKNLCYRNTISGCVGYTGGYFHELFFFLKDSLGLNLSEIRQPDIKKLKNIEKTNPDFKELSGIIRSCIGNYYRNNKDISTKIKLLNDNTQSFYVKQNILSYFRNSSSNDSIALSVVSYIMNGNIFNNSAFKEGYNTWMLLGLITFHAEESKLCSYLDKLRNNCKDHPIFINEINRKQKEYCDY